VPVVAALEHLTGPSRGTVTWVGEKDLRVTLTPDRLVQVSPEEAAAVEGEEVARLRRVDATYELEATRDRPLWVNGREVRTRLLENHDMIEFGDTGPMSRYFLCRNGEPIHMTVGRVLSDALAYCRCSRLPLGRRLLKAAGQVSRRLARETTVLFRIAVVVALAVLAAVAYQQSRISILLRQEIETGAAQLERFSQILARTQQEALTPGDLETLRQELEGRMVTTAERLTELERRSTAAARVIAQSRASIVFLQGAYGFRHAESGRMLRQVLGEDGKPRMLAGGIPLLSLEGEGPVAERQFTGTAFAIGDNGILVTNRHVGQPWETDVNVKALAGQGLEPVLLRFIAWLPGVAEPQAVEVVRTSTEADVAILRFQALGVPVAGLKLADEPPQPGDEVIVMGYPTGMRSMLAQAGEAFVKELQGVEGIDFWAIAERLATAGRIIPLASRGIVGRASVETIVYDAETTYGGSGGPVLDAEGKVVAVNAFILPEYGGSNLGVPAARVRQLLGEAGL
jgi:S1-C subfamily serine protease